MRTLYLRNVPDEVVARLEQLAALAGTSVNVLAVRELEQASRRADNTRGSLATSTPELATVKVRTSSATME